LYRYNLGKFLDVDELVGEDDIEVGLYKLNAVDP
jgi:hypothetical protein